MLKPRALTRSSSWPIAGLGLYSVPKDRARVRGGGSGEQRLGGGGGSREEQWTEKPREGGEVEKRGWMERQKGE